MSYRLDVIPANAPPLQVQECRRAFYSGALACWRAVLDVEDNQEEPTQAEMDHMARIQEEFDAYGEELKKEAAEWEERQGK